MPSAMSHVISRTYRQWRLSGEGEQGSRLGGLQLPNSHSMVRLPLVVQGPYHGRCASGLRCRRRHLGSGRVAVSRLRLPPLGCLLSDVTCLGEPLALRHARVYNYTRSVRRSHSYSSVGLCTAVWSSDE